MKTRSDFVSNSSASSFIVDYETYEKYCDKYGSPGLEPDFNIEDHEGLKCVEFFGWDSDCSVEGYDNDEEYCESLYEDMCNLNPKYINWQNHH